MKKVLTSFALVSALASSAALSEQSGAFGGIDGGYASHKADDDSGYSGFRYGLVGGYKYFLDENLGFRGYANLTFGTKATKGSNNPQLERFDLGVNADVLYNFLRSGDLEYGAFGGLSLDYANNKFKVKNYGDAKANGFDLGINLGLRMNYTQTHGFELWSRFGLVGPKFDEGDGKVKQPYAVGLRYTFNF
ncbi:outer membrane beta-barrel protein [Campylobacter sp. MIT 97-5078]|uniref:outer membrane beta-barrel protein n=1 Tax=Campylobacter sp. MIT 97-5078 TaxID=1548153 RepID=UPI00068A6E60|nr:outer membrane beta-barrel protein [Campylobacter sp. MIT 97-5078]TQR22590.1 outer membrane beta-barrel protein [Campylobacter sp. MIT 97-5078]